MSSARTQTGSWDEPDRLSHQEDSGKEEATSGQGDKKVLLEKGN